MLEKAMSKWACFHSAPLQLPPPLSPTPTIPISFSSSSKQKSFSSSLGHTSMYGIYTLNLWLSDGYIGQLCVIICSKLIFIAYVLLSLNDFDASLLHYTVRFAACFCRHSPVIFLRFTAPLNVSPFHLLPPFLKTKKPSQVKGIGAIALLSSSTLLL